MQAAYLLGGALIAIPAIVIIARKVRNSYHQRRLRGAMTKPPAFTGDTAFSRYADHYRKGGTGRPLTVKGAAFLRQARARPPEVTSIPCYYCDGAATHEPGCPFAIMLDMGEPLYPRLRAATINEIAHLAEVAHAGDIVAAAIALGHTPSVAAAYADEIARECDPGEPLARVPPITVRPSMGDTAIPPPPNMGGIGAAVPYAGPNYVGEEDIAEEMKGMPHFFARPGKVISLQDAALLDDLAATFVLGHVAPDGSIWTAPNERFAVGVVQIPWNERRKAEIFGWEFVGDGDAPGTVQMRRTAPLRREQGDTPWGASSATEPPTGPDKTNSR